MSCKLIWKIYHTTKTRITETWLASSDTEAGDRGKQHSEELKKVYRMKNYHVFENDWRE